MNKNKGSASDYRRQDGFTLIELLVVIAIIGILASVVLASLSSARDKSKDAAVKSQLASMKAQAALYYSTAGDTYIGICGGLSSASGFGGFAGPGLLKAASDSSAIDNVMDSTNIVLTNAGAWNKTICHETVDAWAVEAPLFGSASGLAKMYCVDSTGVSIEKTAVLGASALSCL